MSITAILTLGSQIIDKIIPNPEQKAKAQLELLKLQQEGLLKEAENNLSAIIAEANSTDKWTSRARPSLMYCFYLMILASIPFGLAYTFHPEEARLFIIDLDNWFKAIPEYFVNAFTVGFLGYTGSRTYEKVKGVAK